MARDEQPRGDTGNGDALQGPHHSGLQKLSAVWQPILDAIKGALSTGPPDAVVKGVEQEGAWAASPADDAGPRSVPKERARDGNEVTEERLLEEETAPAAPTLPLKNGGGPMNVRRALVQMQDLQALLDTHPRHFEALLALAQGQTEGVSQEDVKYLREGREIADHSLAVDPEVRDVLISGYQRVPDGHHMGYPFALDNAESMRVVEAAERQIQEDWKRTIFGKGEKGQSR